MAWYKDLYLVLFSIVCITHTGMVYGSSASPPSPSPTAPPSVPASGTVNFQNGADLFFHCGRFGQSCDATGKCDWTTGKCKCDNGFTGFKCDNKISASSSCDKKCQNGGTCLNVGSTSSCVCSSFFTGDLCENKRVSVECSGLTMNITFIPMKEFTGKVYLGNNNSDPLCNLQSEQHGGQTRFQAAYSKDTQVCDGYHEIDVQKGETFTKQLSIQYNPLFLDSTDLVLNLSCFHTANHTVKNEVEITVSKAEDMKKADHKVSENYEPAKLEILSYPNNTALTSEVKLGQWVNMYNSLEDDGVFKSISVDACTVSDPDIHKSVKIIRNKCPSPPAKQIFQKPAARTVSPVGILHVLKIFKLSESTTTLTFTCVVTMCKDANDPQCNLCDDQSVVRRRRRDAESSGLTQRQETRATITIASDEDVRIITSESSPVCADDPMVQTTLVTLSVVSIVLLIACLVLVYCVIRVRSGRSHKGSEPFGRSFRMGNSE